MPQGVCRLLVRSTQEDIINLLYTTPKQSFVEAGRVSAAHQSETNDVNLRQATIELLSMSSDLPPGVCLGHVVD